MRARNGSIMAEQVCDTNKCSCSSRSWRGYCNFWMSTLLLYRPREGGPLQAHLKDAHAKCVAQDLVCVVVEAVTDVG